MRKNCYAILTTCAAICSRTRASSAPPPLMPAFLSYAFAFRRKGVQVKRKRKKTNNRITFPNPLQSPKARFVISRHRVRQDLVADISVPNSPSVTASRAPSRCGSVTRGSDSPPGCHSLPLARLRLRLAYPLHRGGFQVRNLRLALSI